MMELIGEIRQNTKARIYLMLSLIWMGVIFYFSAQPAATSSNMSGFLTRMVESVLVSVFGSGDTQFLAFWTNNLEYIIRKCAHFCEYAILGVLLHNFLISVRFKRSILLSAIMCFLYASSDEFHQMFVPGRSAMLADVMLDSIAACAGIMLVFLFVRIQDKRKRELM